MTRTLEKLGQLLILVYCALLTRPPVVVAKRVLFLPTPATSHAKYHVSVALSLASRGHQVWLAIPAFVAAREVLDTDNLTVVVYQTHGNTEQLMLTGFRDNYFRDQSDDWTVYFRVMKEFCHTLLTNASFYQHIKDVVRPDLIVIDCVPQVKVLTILPYRLGVPFAYLGVVYDPVSSRVPFSPASNPLPFFPFTHHMTFWQRLLNSLPFAVSLFYDFVADMDSVARYAPEKPDIGMSQLEASAEIWLLETDHILDYPKSTLPNVKFVGGTATGPARPLPEPYKSFMDEAEEGVLVVSFGSYVLNLPKPLANKILQVLMELPMKSVFRSDRTSPDPKKILTSTWIPQNDLLGHPNTKAFLSHSGNGGQYEALFHAVPVVGAPIFADQFYNAARFQAKGFGEQLDLRRVTAAELRDTILKVAFADTYKKAISTASEIFKIEFGVPVERAAFWLDHVMKYGGAYMRSATQDMPFYQFLCLDVLLAYLGLLGAVLGLCTSGVCMVVRRLRRQNTKRKKE